MTTFTDEDLDVLIEFSLEDHDTFPLIIRKIREEINWESMPKAINLAIKGLQRNNTEKAKQLLIKHKRI